MLKKTLTYTDYNDVEKTEDFYFNYSKNELVCMQYGVDGGFGEMIQAVSNAKNNREILKIFRDFMLGAYGVKTGDGRFMKSPEIRDAFEHSAAFDELFMECFQNADTAAAFVNGVVPKKDN